MKIKNQLTIAGEEEVIRELYDLVLTEDASGTLFTMKWIVSLPKSFMYFLFGNGQDDLNGYIAYKESGLSLDEFLKYYKKDVDIPLGRELYTLCHKWKCYTPQELRYTLWGSDVVYATTFDSKTNTISFITNNTAPLKAIDELSNLFPELAFDYYYADQKGYYTGHHIYGLGCPRLYKLKPFSSEAKSVVKHIWKGDEHYAIRSA